MVVSALDTVTGKRLAIKKCANLFVDPVDARKIGREIRIMSQLNHPNIIKARGAQDSRLHCDCSWNPFCKRRRSLTLRILLLPLQVIDVLPPPHADFDDVYMVRASRWSCLSR